MSDTKQWNRERAARIKTAVAAVEVYNISSRQIAARDLFCDLLHFCDTYRINPMVVIQGGYVDYRAEGGKAATALLEDTRMSK